jgi:uncharacterized protein YggU (UPF0235/DUF167 family)
VADLELVVTPRAAENRVGPWADGVLRVRVTRPPAAGEANRVVLRLVARALGLSPGRLEIVSGAGARRKRVRVHELDGPELERRLAALTAD